MRPVNKLLIACYDLTGSSLSGEICIQIGAVGVQDIVDTDLNNNLFNAGQIKGIPVESVEHGFAEYGAVIIAGAVVLIAALTIHQKLAAFYC